MSAEFEGKFTKICATGDHFRLAVMGMSLIEQALVELISEALPTSHRLELKRSSFGFKIDLAVGLGGLNPESKPLLTRLVKIRNKCAHEFVSVSETHSDQELLSCMKKHHWKLLPEGFDELRPIFGYAVVAAYHSILEDHKVLKFIKLRRQDASDDAEALLSVIGEQALGYLKDPEVAKRKAKLDEQINQVKMELQNQRADQKSDDS